MIPYVPLNRLILLFVALWGGTILVQAQELLRGGLLREGARYHVELQAQTGSSKTAFYAQANRYGLSTLRGDAGYLRVGATRDVAVDSARRWRMGYGIDVAALLKHTSAIAVHQAYADVEYDWARLTIGAKVHPMQMKNQSLSMGNFTMGKNSRPVPEVRLEVPEYVVLDKKGWLAVKGHLAYGISTDGAFQKSYVSEGEKYVRGARIHTRSGFVRVGNQDKCPLTFEAGLEMAAQYGGTIYNLNTAGYVHLPMSNGIGAMWHALIPGGNDVTDEGYDNAVGNTLGSYLLALSYKSKKWGVRAYYDHFFEDHSQQFLQYNWRDGLWGIEAQLSENGIVQQVVYEHINTTHQSGPLYHDRTPTIRDQVSARDSYYSHVLYGSWSHWGQYIGNPLFITPLYRNDGSLRVLNNRFVAHHVAVAGQPLPDLGYRMMATFTSNRGTYDHLYERIKRAQHYLVEVDYAPKYLGRHYVEGWRATLGLAIDRGSHVGHNTSLMLTISRSGNLFH